MAAIEQELVQLGGTLPKDKPVAQPKRQMQRIGQDVSEKLDYVPGTFTVERHIRGKWACRQCETLMQTPVPAQVIQRSGHDGLAGTGADR